MRLAALSCITKASFGMAIAAPFADPKGLHKGSAMRLWEWLRAVVTTLACTVLLAVLFSGSHGAKVSATPSTRSDRLASSLTAEAELAHYAASHSASREVRELGESAARIIGRRAAAEHIRLPAAMCDDDRRWVTSLESRKGEAFDSLYLSITAARLEAAVR
jgi:hypothetical protein